MDAHKQQIMSALSSARNMKAAHAPGSPEHGAAAQAEELALRQLRGLEQQDAAQAAAQRSQTDYGYGGLADDPIICVAGDSPGQARIDPGMVGIPDQEPAPRIVIGGGGPLPQGQAAPRSAVVEPGAAGPGPAREAAPPPPPPPQAAAPGPSPGPRPAPAPGIPAPKKVLTFRDTGELVTWITALGALAWTGWKFYKEIRR